jgi:hypothetical protein
MTSTFQASAVARLAFGLSLLLVALREGRGVMTAVLVAVLWYFDRRAQPR